MTSLVVQSNWISPTLLQHAERYATELTNQYLLERWKKDFPDLFRHVTYSTRPADSAQDYYVPAKLQPKAIVIEHDTFDDAGCAKLACFPFDHQLKDCRQDPPRWIPLGEQFGVACQRACDWSSVDTEFRSGKCMQLNTLKKMLAAAPEEYLGMKSKFHAGLDLVDGQLKLNARYCHGYGVQFEDDDCSVPTGQAIAEIFVGSTVYRSIATAQLPPRKQPIVPVPRYLLKAKPWSGRTVPNTASQRPKRSALPQPQANWTTVASEVAKDVSIDMGVDVSVDVVAHVLKKRLPSFLLKKTLDLPVRSAVTRAVVQSHAKTLASVSKGIGKGLNAANVVLLGYGLVTMLLDLIDPFEYNKFLTKEDLQKINQQLDEDFFGRVNGFEVEITPTYVLHNVLDEEDQSEQWEYFENRVREYLLTMQNVPQKSRNELIQKPISWMNVAATPQKWMDHARTVGTVVLLLMAFTLPEYVGVVGCLILALYCAHHRWTLS